METVTKTHLGTLREALESGTLRQVQTLVNSLHPAECALLLESLPVPERAVVWELIKEEDEGDILVELNDEVRAKLIEEMDADEVVAATEGMELDDLADLVADLPEAVTQRVIESLSLQDRERLEALLSCPEDTAGGLRDPDTITVRPDVSLEVVLRVIEEEIPASYNLLTKPHLKYPITLEIACTIHWEILCRIRRLVYYLWILRKVKHCNLRVKLKLYGMKKTLKKKRGAQ